jgi:hypothetical protein
MKEGDGMSRPWTARAGLVGFGTGVIGGLGALVLLFWPAQVAEGPVSYPFTTKGFLMAQGFFFVHHLGLVALLVALALSATVGTGRLARAGAWLAVIGMAMLTGTELLAMRYADWDFDTANAGPMGASYGIACMVVGIGMIAAGIGILRAGVWSGWHAWTPLVIGISQFVVLTPGMFGGFAAARLAIGFWMLTFAALGGSMFSEARRTPVRAQPSVAATSNAQV